MKKFILPLAVLFASPAFAQTKAEAAAVHEAALNAGDIALDMAERAIIYCPAHEVVLSESCVQARKVSRAALEEVVAKAKVAMAYCAEPKNEAVCVWAAQKYDERLAKQMERQQSVMSKMEALEAVRTRARS